MSKRPSIQIAIMGVTGAGKSTFIKTASELPNVGIGHDLHSFTETVEAYKFQHRDIDVILIDTPGFNDTELKEGDVLKSIADWLDFNYRNSRRKLNGIIYLQSIIDPRMTGSSLRNLKMFQELCGTDPMKNVLMVSTRWGMAERSGQHALAEKRENQLRDEYWSKMLGEGARLDRFDDTRESALRLIMSLRDSDPLPLQIQSEMVDEDKRLAQTSAGITVNEEFTALEQKHKQEMAEYREEIEAARQAQDKRLQEALEDAREESRRKLEQVYQQQDALQYQRRAQDRRIEDELDDMRAYTKKLETLLGQLGAQNLDFDSTVATLEANTGKLRREQRDAVRREIDEVKKQPKKQRTVWRLLLGLLPVLGSIAFAIIGIPMPMSVFGGLGDLFGGDGS